jgi:hypothetical protein
MTARKATTSRGGSTPSDVSLRQALCITRASQHTEVQADRLQIRRKA